MRGLQLLKSPHNLDDDERERPSVEHCLVDELANLAFESARLRKNHVACEATIRRDELEKPLAKVADDEGCIWFVAAETSGPAFGDTECTVRWDVEEMW